MSLRFAHLSDVHLGPLPAAPPRAFLNKRLLGLLSWTLRRRYRHRGEVLEAVVEDLRSLEPGHVLLTGDLTNLSLPEEFVRSATWLHRLAPVDRVMLIPGNHDAYLEGAWRPGWRHWSPWMNGGRAGDPVFPLLRRWKDLAFLGLSSAVPSPPGYASGRLGGDQLRRLAGMLDGLAAEDCFRIVMVHHPPIDIGRPRKELEDRAGLAGLLLEKGAELVLCGHEHRFALGFLRGSGREIPVLQAPSASMWAREPERQGGYLFLELERQEGGWLLEISRRSFDPQQGQVRETARERLRWRSGSLTAGGCEA